MSPGDQQANEAIDASLYGHRISEWQQIRPLAHWMVFFDPVTRVAYSHRDYLAEDVQARLVPRLAFESHSERAYFIVDQNELMEYKGLTWPYSDRIVPASGQPRGLLLKEHGAREARALTDIAGRGGSVKAEYHDAGFALLKRAPIAVKPLTAEWEKEHGKEVDGEIVQYGVLKRWGDDYIPFIRLDLFQIVRELANFEGIGYVELLSNAMERFGSVLRTAHELGIYHCFTHPGNVDAHGNLIDYEHAIYRDEIACIQQTREPKSEDAEFFSEACLRFRDIDLFFGGSRALLRRCQERFQFTREELMLHIKFLRENIALSVGIPVFELLAHLNIGFYADTLKKLRSEDQRRVIAAFIEAYCDADQRDMVKQEVFLRLARDGEWTEAVSGCITDPEHWTDIPARQLSSEFILDLWTKPPLKP
ncbi:MAG: hypothetical protein EFT35_04725 [Methanophagales archaeon ANME-1-THS]|nr:MAG: hypothetical protein EFT35_04725 [Methanophagales archaeon ANME-1-THS]